MSNQAAARNAMARLPLAAGGPVTAVQGLVELVDVVLCQDHLDALTDAVVNWAARDEATVVPGVRESANTAMKNVDLLLQAAYRLRAELVGQIRRFDDASMVRVDALLAEGRARRERPQPGLESSSRSRTPATEEYAAQQRCGHGNVRATCVPCEDGHQSWER